MFKIFLALLFVAQIYIVSSSLSTASGAALEFQQSGEAFLPVLVLLGVGRALIFATLTIPTILLMTGERRKPGDSSNSIVESNVR